MLHFWDILIDQPFVGLVSTRQVPADQHRRLHTPGNKGFGCFDHQQVDGEYVTEYPVARGGVSVNNADAQPIEKLDQLLNFTNYNKPTKGGWLDKYQ